MMTGIVRRIALRWLALRIPDAPLPASTWLLTLAQAVNLTCAVISVTAAAIVGSELAATPALGTVPYGAQFASMTVFTYPASMLMRRFGRRPVFTVAAGVLVACGILGFLAVERASFVLLTLAHVLLGMYIACANFYRFAAVDHVPALLRPRAMSLVIAGGVIAAFAGPLLASALREVGGFADFSLVYGVMALLGLLNLLLVALWRPDSAPLVAPATVPVEGRPAAAGAWLAIFCSAGGYLVMNLLMVEASLVMRHLCTFAEGAFAIQAHVLAMFAPSFFTGRLLARIGAGQVLTVGFTLLGASAAFALLELRYVNVFAGLVLLGLGWNFAYVGGGALLALSVPLPLRHRWQGIHDTAVAACATVGAFLPAVLLAWLGWRASNLAVLAFCVIGAVLCRMCLRPVGERHGLARGV